MINRMISSKLLLVLMCIAWCPLVPAQQIPDGSYLGQAPPDNEPQIFAPGIVTLTNRNEFHGSFTPDGQEFYFAVSTPGWSEHRVMMVCQQQGHWITPEMAPFSGWGIDWGVYLSPDGQQLFFGSSRPQDSWAIFNIWMCERQGSTWSEPVKLGFNSSGRDYAGTCTWDGTHYFGSERHGLISIFRSVLVAGKYAPVEKLPYPINTSGRDLNPWIAPDESYLIFASDRGNNQDLYISYRNGDDSWTEPINLGPSVNSQDSEWNPSLSPDGQYLFFSRSTGVPTANPQNFDLYWVSTKTFLPDITNSTDPNGPIQNLTTGNRYGSIQSAINYAKAGAMIIIEPGVYQETITIDKNLVIQSADPNDSVCIGGTIIQSDMNKPVLTLGDYAWDCEIAGLTLRAGSVGIKGTATNSMFRNCRIMDNITNGVELYEVSKPHLLGCLIVGNGQAGIKMYDTQSGRRILFCEPTIENCYIVDNNEAGIVGGNPVILDSVIQGQ